MKLVHDLENDLEHTIPPVGGLDSEVLFEAMTQRSLALLAARPGETLVDLACGMGQDTLRVGDQVQAHGAAPPHPTRIIGLEPSSRMIGWGRHWLRERKPAPPVHFVRGLGEELPLRSDSVDGLLCKGALDHFMDAALTLREVHRVLKPGGRAVIALANYDSLSCRLGRWLHRMRAAEAAAGNGTSGTDPHAHQHYFEPPPDHLIRFGHREIVALAAAPLRLERVEGVSLLWNFPPWAALLRALPAALARGILGAAHGIARGWPQAADVVILRAVKPKP